MTYVLLFALNQVGIWEERKVFGSRSQNLKNDIVGKNPSPGKNHSPVENLTPPVNNGKKPNPIKVVKKDAIALRIVSTMLCCVGKNFILRFCFTFFC